jgi:AcrR family transcriptional regulator
VNGQGTKKRATPRRPDLAREFIEAARRRSFALAAAEVAHEFGIHAVTVSFVCQVAGSARNTFYDHFANVGECLRHGVREAFELLFMPFREVGDGEWLEEVERAIAGFYGAAAREPMLAELLLVHSFGIALKDEDPDLDAGVVAMTALLARGREEVEGEVVPIPLAEDYLARVISSLAALKLRREEAETLPAHTREMTTLVGIAYLGPQRTMRILEPAGGGS